MAFDKSLKLLNYAKNIGGFLQLYTELDHSFVIGDKLFIVGGYYDNTQELSFISDYSPFTPTVYNPFNSNKSGYTVTSVDYSTNSFIIDYPVALLVYPYGTNDNTFGNPQNATNLAYNTFTGNNLYKGIYVSKTCFINGRFRKGTINNGIFGNDSNLVRLNAHENRTSIQTDIVINHIVSKNTKLNGGVIKSKTDTINPVTKKYKVIEDSSVGTLLNPFSITPVSIDSNNNSFGYSLYERFNVVGNTSIYNGEFNNPKANFITLNNCTIIKGKIGDTDPIETNANILSAGNFNNLSLGNFTNNVGTLAITGGKMNTFYNLKPISVAWGVTAGELIFTVDYNTVANKNWTIGTQCYVSGIRPLGNLDKDSTIYDINFSFANITSVSYTFGNTNSAQIKLVFGNLIAGWVAWSSSYTPSQFDFSNTKISINTFNNLTVSNNTELSTVILDNGNSYIDSTVTVKEGYYDGIVYHASVPFLGTDVGQAILLLNSKQIYQSDVTVNPTFSYTKFTNAISPVKGNLTNCIMTNGTIHNSTIDSCFIKPIIGGDQIYLYNSMVTGQSLIDSAVKYDLINFNGTYDTVVYDGLNNASIVSKSNLGLRKTPFKTGPIASYPYSANYKFAEFNKFTGNPSMLIYNSQTIVKPGAGLKNFTLRYYVPSVEFITNAGIELYTSIIDHGDMSYNVNDSWIVNSSNKRSDVLFSGNLADNNNKPLRIAIEDRTTYNISTGIDPDFTGITITNPIPNDSLHVIRNITTGFIYDELNYYNDVKPRAQTDITINIYDNPPVPVGQPDPAYASALTSFLALFYPGEPGQIDNIMPGSTTSLPSDTYDLQFRHDKPRLVGNVIATSVPACFIEIERVIVNGYNASNNLKSITIHNCNYCAPVTGYATNGQEYTWDHLVPGNSYPTGILILKPPYGPANRISFTKTATGNFTKVVVQVEFWITWYYAANQNGPTLDALPFNGFNGGGKREKKTDTYTFIN